MASSQVVHEDKNSDQLIIGHLAKLYDVRAQETWQKLLQVINEHRPRIAQSFAEHHRRDEEILLTERDVIMIAYGDHLLSSTMSPLQTLANWCKEHVGGLISAVHVLPFHPSTSYYGYSITDYTAVDANLGTWADMHLFEENGFSLMSDLVLNHCSQSHPWFQQFLRGEKPGCDYFISRYHPDEPWLAHVKRARNLPLISAFTSATRETRYVWTTYHRDLVDLDWANPDVCVEFVRILLDSVAHGFRFVRLDAFAYVWKRVGTTCVNLPETKDLLQVFLHCLKAAGASSVSILPSITNATQQQNFEFLLAGASLVYHLPLSALLLHTLYSGSTQVLTQWLQSSPPTPRGRHLLNLASSHDGIGLTWCAEILSPDQVHFICDQARARGGILQTRKATAATRDDAAAPWEINITYFSACSPEDNASSSSPSLRMRTHVDRFLATQSIVVALKGVPALYFSLFMAGENDLRGMETIRTANVDTNAHCIERAINRGRYQLAEWQLRMQSPDDAPQSLVLKRLQRLVRSRVTHAAFHPDGPQEALHLPLFPSLFILKRTPLLGSSDDAIFCITNFASHVVRMPAVTAIELLGSVARLGGGLCIDLLHEQGASEDERAAIIDARRDLEFRPYGTYWLAAMRASPSKSMLASFVASSKRVDSVPRTPLSSDAPARTLQVNDQPLLHLFAFSATSKEGQTALQSSPRAKLVHFIRHAPSLHKQIASLEAEVSGGQSRCLCFEETLGVARTRAMQAIIDECEERGTRPKCPYLSEAGFDSPLTAEGREVLHIVAKQVAQLCPTLGRTFAAASIRTLETACAIAPPSSHVIASEFLRPMLGFHTHSHRTSRSILAALFPSVDFSHLQENDLPLERGAWESRRSMDARASAALAQVMQCEERQVAVVAHFTTLYAMFMAGSDARIFGTRNDVDQRPLLDCSLCPLLSRMNAEPALNDAALLSLVLVEEPQVQVSIVPPPPPLPRAAAMTLDDVCKAILLGDAGKRGTFKCRPISATGEDEVGLWHMLLLAAASSPSTVAVYLPASRLTFGEVLLAALRLVRRMQVPHGAYVGAFLERNSWNAVVAFAVIIAGGVYFALHPNDPANRRAAVIGIIQPAVVIVSNVTAHLCKDLVGVRLLNIDEESPHDETSITAEWLATLSSPQLSQPAYCTFTSGSTGPPKAVLLSHRAVVQFIVSLRAYDISSGASPDAIFGASTRTLQLSRSSFDISWFELLGPLCVGGATVIMPDIEKNFSIEAIVRAIATHGVTWCFVVPAVARLLLDHLHALAEAPRANSIAPLRTLIIGGEPVGLPLARALQLALPRCRIVHAYGPAECTIFTTVYTLRNDDESLPLGFPLPDYRIVLLDPQKRQVGRGQIGTMYVIGNAVMSRYLGDDAATKSALVPVTIDEEGGDRKVVLIAYNTGDLARMDATGALHFIGRRDRQVKLHGQRLELSAVEAAIHACDAVNVAVVKKHTLPPDRQFLVAYVVWRSKALAQYSVHELEAQLRQDLSLHLLAWMIPSVIHTIERDLPRNSHGKVDWQALPAPSLQERPQRRWKICIIGGGVAAMLLAIEGKKRGFEVTIIERASSLGGVWSNGAASAHSQLQQPGEYYSIDGALPSRFPATAALGNYLSQVCDRNSLQQHAILSSEVIDVATTNKQGSFSVTWQRRENNKSIVDPPVTRIFDAVVCATGRFNPLHPILPSWATSTTPPRMLAMNLDPSKCTSKRVVIVGGGPYAVEAVRVCQLGNPTSLDLVVRKPHWVFPRSWFASRALTRLFWRVCAGVNVRRRIVLLVKIALARHYLRAGIAHLIPKCPLTDPKTAISDEFFDHARLPHVKYHIGQVTSAASDVVSLDNVKLPCDVLVIACGFERPSYPFLRRFEPLELYLGSWHIASPRLCFVGVGLGEGGFPNPHTMRPQVDLVLNHLERAGACDRTREEMQSWLRGSERIDGEVPGAATHMSEHLHELVYQRRMAAGRQSMRSSNETHPMIEQEQQSQQQQQQQSVSQLVIRAAQEAGLTLSEQHVNQPLVSLGMDSLGAVRFRSVLCKSFPHQSLPPLGSLLWQFPTLAHVIKLLESPTNPSLPATSAPCNGNNNAAVEDVEPIFTREEAVAYVCEHLGLSGLLPLRNTDVLSFITRICEQFHRIVPFQSFTLLNVDQKCRQLPSLAKLKRDVLARIGGCCYVLNVFMRELLRAFAFNTYFARCAIHGVEDCHMTVIVRDLLSPSDLWMVDVGCGYITPRPMCLSWGDAIESPVYQHGFLRLKFVRAVDQVTNEPVVLRLHAAESTFDRRELSLTGKRNDEFTHLFWKMSLRPRPMHDEGETQQVLAFVNYQKLRASIGIGAQCRMVYFKGDNFHGQLIATMQEDIDGKLIGRNISREELVNKLCEYFPSFSRASLEDAVARVVNSSL